MRRDEFNNVNVTNDKQLRGVEFGRTTNNEIFSQRENVVNQGELNSVQAKDELNEGVSDVRQGTHHDDFTQEELKKQIQNNSSIGSESSSAGSSSATGASSAGAAGSSAAASAGSAAASTASTVAVSASAIVVTAFTVITAAPIIISQATAQLMSFEVGENAVFYEIKLDDVVENGEYKVILSNNTYNESQPLEAGLNHGEFFDLESNTEYTLEVEEGSEIEIKRNLLRKVFTTEEGIIGVSEFRDFIFDKTADFLTNSFTIQLDYIDELDIFSDFTFTLTDISDSSITDSFLLDKTTEAQTIDLNTSEVVFDLEKEYNYKLSYKENGSEIIYKEELFSFIEKEDRQSIFSGVYVNPKADLKENTFIVSLDYVDELGWLDNIILHFSDSPTKAGGSSSSSPREYVLSKNTDEQQLSANEEGDHPGFDLAAGTYYYHISYTRNGVPMETDVQEVSFTDKDDRETVFTSATVDNKADFLERTFKVQLGFIDELGRLDNFEFHIAEADSIADIPFERTYSLEKSLEEQVLSADEDPENVGFDLESGTYTCYFTYTNNGKAVSTDPVNVTFEDVEGRSSEFYSVIINEADFEEKTFNVQLEFIDGLNRLDGWHLSIKDETKDITLSYDLEETLEAQAFSAIDPETKQCFDLEHSSFSYSLTYNEFGVEQKVEDETRFLDKNGKSSTVSAPIFNTDDDGFVYFNYYTGMLDVTLDYKDYFDYFDDFRLVFSNVGADPEDPGYEIDLETTSELQSIYAGMGPEYGVDMTVGDPINYELIYHTIADPDTPISAATGTISFTDNSVVEISDIEVGSIKYDGGSYYVPYKLNFVDERDELGDIEIHINNSKIGDTYLVQLTDDGFTNHDMKWQYAYFSYGGGLSDIIDEPVTISAIHSGDDTPIFSKEMTLVYDDETDFMTMDDIRLREDAWMGGLEDATCSFSYRYAVRNGDAAGRSFTIRFVDSELNQYDIPGVDVSSYIAGSDTVNITTSEYTDFVSKVLSGKQFSVYIIYTDSEDNDVSVLCYTSFSFLVV